MYLKGASPFAEPNLATNRRGAQFAKNRLCWTFFGIDSTDQVMWMAHKNTLSMPKGCQQSRSKTVILLFAEKLLTSVYRVNGWKAFPVVKGFYHYTRKLKKWFALGTKNVDIRWRDEWSKCLISCQRAARVTMLLLLVKKDFGIHFEGTIFWTDQSLIWSGQKYPLIPQLMKKKPDETIKRFCFQGIEWFFLFCTKKLNKAKAMVTIVNL